jgi:hypothetical protein
MYRTVIFKDDRRLRLFGNRMLRKIFYPERQAGAGD